MQSPPSGETPYQRKLREQRELATKPAYPVIIGEASVGSARSAQEAINKVGEYAMERYGWRYADGRNMTSLMTAALDHLVSAELGYNPRKDRMFAQEFEAEIGVEKRRVWLITIQRHMETPS